MQLPFDGVLLQRPDMIRATFRFLTENDLPTVLAFREPIAAATGAQRFVPLDDDGVRRSLTNGIGIGCFAEERLIAMLLAQRPDANGSTFADLLNWDEDQAARSIDVDEVVVAPDYRGNGLQELLLCQLEAVCIDEGYWHLLTTVSPDNTPSLDNVRRRGFFAEKQADLYGGYPRLILHKPIGAAARKRALLLIDYTYDFVAPDGKLTCGPAGQAIDGAIASLVSDAAQAGDEIFVLNDIHEQDDRFHPESRLFPPHNIAGSSGRELYGATRIAVEDAAVSCPDRVHRLDKTRYSAFAGTPLAQLLRARRIEEVLLAGVCTDICILHTAVSAYNEGFRVSVARQGVASFDPAGHEYALKHLENVIGANVYNLRKIDESAQRF